VHHYSRSDFEENDAETVRDWLEEKGQKNFFFFFSLLLPVRQVS